MSVGRLLTSNRHMRLHVIVAQVCKFREDMMKRRIFKLSGKIIRRTPGIYKIFCLFKITFFLRRIIKPDQRQFDLRMPGYPVHLPFVPAKQTAYQIGGAAHDIKKLSFSCRLIISNCCLYQMPRSI